MPNSDPNQRLQRLLNCSNLISYKLHVIDAKGQHRLLDCELQQAHSFVFNVKQESLFSINDQIQVRLQGLRGEYWTLCYVARIELYNGYELVLVQASTAKG